MKRTLAASVLVAAAILAFGLRGEQDPSSNAPAEPAPVAEAASEAPGEDVLAQTLEINSQRYAAPPAPTRQGNVSVRKLADEAIRRRQDGFVVALPSQAPLTAPAVYQGKVMVSGGFHSREFYALDAKTGEPVWALDLDDDGPSTAACEDRVCVFNTESCTVFAVDAESGKLLWAWWLGDPLMSAPTIAGGRVFTSYPVPAAGYGQNVVQNVPQHAAPSEPETGSELPRPPETGHALIAFELRSGRILWQRWIDSDVLSAPVAAGSELVVATLAGTVYRFAQDDGRILAARQERATSAPTVDGEAIYFSKRTDGEDKPAEEGLASANREDGAAMWVSEKKAAPYLDAGVQARSKMWDQGLSLDAGNGFGSGAPASAKVEKAAENVGQASVSTLQSFQGSRIVKSGSSIYSAMGDEIVCTSKGDGKRRWSVKLAGDLEEEGGFLAAPPVPTPGGLLVVTLAGDLMLLDAETGKKLRSWQLDTAVRSQPVVDEGWIYVGTQDGHLVAIDTGDPAITGWPMWGGNAARNG